MNLKATKSFLLIGVLFLISSCQSGQKSFKTNLAKKRLPNKIEVLSFKDKSLPFFKMIVWSSDGYTYEPSDALGVTNLMANLLIEGSENKHFLHWALVFKLVLVLIKWCFQLKV
jgi:hypothetical protein